MIVLVCQSYCVPGWTVMDNFFLIRGVIDLARLQDVGVFSIR